MKKEELAFIGCRLIALFYVTKLLETVGSFATFLVMWRTQAIDLPLANVGMIFLQILPFTFYVIIACLLWFGAGTIVRSLLPDTEFNQNSRSISAEQVQSVAFTTIGLLMLTWGVTGLAKVLYQVFQLNQASNFAHFSNTLKAEGITVACQILFGFYLILGSQGLSKLVARLRQPKLNKI
ncbi:hypothetical protein [uncultured Gimesia sp.]|uniref:hypothetical protein n=1 Tax=uncultured Gimesia sp. TaxID=1678688 RepID=UPI002633C978|nr:hypothetical protein [uncultured Gimesia sp.]